MTVEPGDHKLSDLVCSLGAAATRSDAQDVIADGLTVNGFDVGGMVDPVIKVPDGDVALSIEATYPDTGQAAAFFAGGSAETLVDVPLG